MVYLACQHAIRMIMMWYEAARLKQEVARRRRRSCHAPVCPPGRRKTTGGGLLGWASRWAASWAGQVSGPGKILSLSSLFCIVFYYFFKFVAFLEIPRHFQKSPNCSCPLYRI